MTYAWYGHLKYVASKPVYIAIALSWFIAFFEYCFQVPANRIGFESNGGPFNLWQLKVIQEAITLTVFTVFTLVVFKDQKFTYNHVIGFIFMILSVYFIFRK